MTRTVAIYVFDDVEVLDFSGPFEVFSVANRLAERDGASMPFRVVTVARDNPAVTARGGYRFVASHTIADAPAIDVLIVPGGVVDGELAHADVIDWIRRVDTKTEITASVCTGAFVLAAAGLLAGRAATTHWEDIDDLARRHPDITIVNDVPWVDEGPVVTSAGISAGIEMSLHLVGRLTGPDLAIRTARQMQYTWTGEGQ